MAVPHLLRPLHTDEFGAPLLAGPTHRAAVRLAAGSAAPGRCETARTLRALDAEWGGGFFAIPEEAEHDPAAAAAAFDHGTTVVDVQTHLVDATRWHGAAAGALGAFLREVDPARWPTVDPRAIDAASWAELVFARSETAIAVLTSTPGPPDRNVLTNDQIAATREVVERYAGSPRVLSHAIVHPNLPGELERIGAWSETLRPDGWKVYTLYGPGPSPERSGWFLDDPEIGLPFLDAVRAHGPRVVATHKGLGGPVPDPALDASSPRDIGPAARAYPDIELLVYHSGFELGGSEGPYREASGQGVDRLVTSLLAADVGPGANVWAELGSTWFLLLRDPPAAAHVLGKLLRAVGPDRILWGTDSTWYGSPQPLIDAFAAFTIPERMQAEHGYPALDASTKRRILSANARRVYAIADATVADAAADRDRTWVDLVAPDLVARLEGRAGSVGA